MELHRIWYSKKYQAMGVKYHGRHCVVEGYAKKGAKPFNCLVRLKGNERAIVSYGNLNKVKGE